MQGEMAVQELVLGNEPDVRKKPRLAMRLARLHSACGNYARVAGTAARRMPKPENADQRELFQDWGHALCKLHRRQPASPDYQRGVELLRRSLALYRSEGVLLCPQFTTGFKFARARDRPSGLGAGSAVGSRET